MKYMSLAIQESLKAPWYGYVPIGGVLTCNGNLVFAHHNGHGFQHVEWIIVQYIFSRENPYAIKDNYVLYVTQEPCVMCWFVIHNSPIKTVYFGTFNESYGGFSNAIKWKTKTNKKIFGGIKEEINLRILQCFFQHKR